MVIVGAFVVGIIPDRGYTFMVLGAVIQAVWAFIAQMIERGSRTIKVVISATLTIICLIITGAVLPPDPPPLPPPTITPSPTPTVTQTPVSSATPMPSATPEPTPLPTPTPIMPRDYECMGRMSTSNSRIYVRDNTNPDRVFETQYSLDAGQEVLVDAVTRAETDDGTRNVDLYQVPLERQNLPLPAALLPAAHGSRLQMIYIQRLDITFDSCPLLDGSFTELPDLILSNP